MEMVLSMEHGFVKGGSLLVLCLVITRLLLDVCVEEIPWHV